MAEGNLSGFPWWTKKFSSVEVLVLIAVEAYGPLRTVEVLDHFLLSPYREGAVRRALGYLVSRGMLSRSQPTPSEICDLHPERASFRKGVCRGCYHEGRGEDHRTEHTYTINVPGAGFGRGRKAAEA